MPGSSYKATATENRLDISHDLCARCVHDHCNTDKTKRRTDDVKAIGTKTIHDHSPSLGTGNKDAAMRR